MMSLLDTMERTLRGFRRNGMVPDAWRLGGGRSRSVSLGVRDNHAGNAYSPLAHHQGEGVGYLVRWSDGRISRGSVDRGHGDAETALEAALESAYDDEDGAVIPGPDTFPDVDLHSADVVAVVEGDREPFRRILDEVRDLARRRGYGTYSGSMHAAERESEVRTSEGLRVEARSTSWSWHMHFEGEFGDSSLARSLGDPAEPARRLATACDLVDRLRRPDHDPPSGACPVLFHPRLVESLLDTYVFGNLSGSAVWHGQAAFRREQFERRERVFRPDLRIGVDPVRPRAYGSYRFTGEGVPARATDFVRDGKLRTPVLGLKFARRFGLEPTGLPGAADTLVLEGPPHVPFEEALAGMDRGLFALSLLGLHTQDATRGEFSLSAPQALVVDGGRLRGRAKVVLAGDFLKALAGEDLVLVDLPDQPLPGLLLPCRVHPASTS
jgi:PmbA protein